MLTITNPLGLLIAANVERGTAMKNAHKLNAYYNSYPYYSISEVFKAFKVADIIAINIFEMNEMPIINGTHFISFPGLIKLLIAFGANPSNAYSVYENGGSLDDLKMNIVKDRKKWPIMTRVTSWPTMSQMPSKDVRILMHLFSSIIPPTIKLPSTIIDKTAVNDWEQLSNGCTQTTIQSRILSIGRESPNVRRKKDGRHITINKKFRPMYARRSIAVTDFVREMVAVHPIIMIPYIYPSSTTDINYDVTPTQPSKRSAGYIIEYVNGNMAIIGGEDPSVSMDVARTCPLHDITYVNDALKTGWSFDEICMIYGPRC